LSAPRPLSVILDCDGVLVDSEALASRVEAEVTRELGLDLTTEQAHELFLGKTVAGVLDAIAQRSGSAPSAGFTYNWAFSTAHSFMRELRPIPYLLAAVGELQRRGHPLAVASQSPLARVRFSLDVTGLATFFGEHIYVTSMVRHPKPAPDVYLLAAERLGARHGDCVVVEDSPASAAAALSAGMRAILYAPGEPAAAPRRDGLILMKSMDQLPGLVQALAQSTGSPAS
jgi:HAD superfamily hydrolase (TIGR01509 family)